MISSRATTPPLYLGRQTTTPSLAPAPQLRAGSALPMYPSTIPVGYINQPPSSVAAPHTVPLRIPPVDFGSRSRPASPSADAAQQNKQSEGYHFQPHAAVMPSAGALHFSAASNGQTTNVYHPAPPPQFAPSQPRQQDQQSAQNQSFTAAPHDRYQGQNQMEAQGHAYQPAQQQQLRTPAATTNAYEFNMAPHTDYGSLQQQQHQSMMSAMNYPASTNNYSTASTAAMPQAVYHQQQQEQQQQQQQQLMMTDALIQQYHQKMEQSRQSQMQLDQEEAAINAEESALRLQMFDIEQEKRRVDGELMTINSGWAALFEKESWFHQTPYLDLTSQAQEVEYRCQALQQQLQQIHNELNGHQIELHKFDGNEVVRQRQLASASMLEDCVARMAKRRNHLRELAERHFDTETLRERAARRYCNSLDDDIRSATDRLQQLPPMMGKTNSGFASGMPSRETSVGYPLATSSSSGPSNAASRQRLVTFGPSPVVERGLSAIDMSSLAAPSFTVGLDNEEDETSNDIFGWNANSIAVSLCDAKRPRAESSAITAM